VSDTGHDGCTTTRAPLNGLKSQRNESMHVRRISDRARGSGAKKMAAWTLAVCAARCGSGEALPSLPQGGANDAGAPQTNDADLGDARQSDADAERPLLAASQIPAVFHVAGTQVGDVPRGNHFRAAYCAACHKTGQVGSYDGWSGSLMAQAGRDPLFFAQLATANQDVPGVGYYCLRCHVPNSIITGNAYEPTGSRLDAFDHDGVMCHFCHTLIDPVNERGTTFQDRIDGQQLELMKNKPAQYGNAMFVVAIGGQRRGPYAEESIAFLPHEASYAEFITRADFCGTCHEVGNPTLLQQHSALSAMRWCPVMLSTRVRAFLSRSRMTTPNAEPRRLLGKRRLSSGVEVDSASRSPWIRGCSDTFPPPHSSLWPSRLPFTIAGASSSSCSAALPCSNRSRCFSSCCRSSLFWGGDGPVQVFELDSGFRAAIEVAYRALVAPPGMTYAIPALLWWALLALTRPKTPMENGDAPRATTGDVHVTTDAGHC